MLNDVFKKAINRIFGISENKKKSIRCSYCGQMVNESVYIPHLYDFHGIDVAEKYGYKKVRG